MNTGLAQRPDQALDDLDPVLACMSRASGAQVWKLTRITPREKVFCSVAADVCQGTLGIPFELHLRLAAKHGISMTDIREVIRFVSYDSGYHVALAAMQRVSEVEAGASALRDEMSTHVDAIEDAAAGTDNPLPSFARAALDDLGSEGFSAFMALQSRMRRDPLTTLSVRERAFITLTVDIVYQTLGDTFRIHANRALVSGADRETVREAVAFSALFGAARTWTALRELRNVFAELDARAQGA